MIWGVIIAALLVLTGVIAWLLWRAQSRRIHTTNLRLLIPSLPEALRGLRLAFLSDLHEGALYVTREELLSAVDEADPELLLLGGDYAAARRHRPQALSLVRELASGRPTFGVPGNTEHHFHFDFDALAEAFAAGGGALLVNETRQAPVRGVTIEIIGLDDPQNGRMDINAALADACEAAGVRICLVHSPAIWQDLERIGADITLCGHSHGGQIRPPGLEAPLTHLSYPARLAAGLFRHSRGQIPVMQRVAGHWWILSRGQRPITVSARHGPLLYVSRGVGVSLLPFRFLCPPELVVLELVPERPESAAGGTS